MITWKKIIFNKSNTITRINNTKNFLDFSNEVEPGGYKPNDYYMSKEKFFDHYLKKDRYKIWSNYLKDNLEKNKSILSIASGRAINELDLISNNYDITCSDLEVPECYNVSLKLFGKFKYIKLDILKNKTEKKFHFIFCISALYIFSNSQLEKIFSNLREMLDKDGVLIIDFGGSEDNYFSFFFHEIYLVFEAYLIYFFSKIFKKDIGFEIHNNHGYRRKNKEIFKFAEKIGFKFLSYSEFDHSSELQRSSIIRKIIELFPISAKIFRILGKRMSYIRFFKFAKK